MTHEHQHSRQEKLGACLEGFLENGGLTQPKSSLGQGNREAYMVKLAPWKGPGLNPKGWQYGGLGGWTQRDAL